MHRPLSLILVLAAVPVAQAGLHFNFSSSSPVSAEVTDAFQQAGQRWSDQFYNDIDVNVRIGFHSLKGTSRN